MGNYLIVLQETDLFLEAVICSCSSSNSSLKDELKVCVCQPKTFAKFFSFFVFIYNVHVHVSCSCVKSLCNFNKTNFIAILQYSILSIYPFSHKIKFYKNFGKFSMNFFKFLLG